MNSDKKITVMQKIKSCTLPRLTRQELLNGATCALVSFVLGVCSLPFSIYPLGIVLFCAASKTALFALVGVLISALVAAPDTLLYISALFVALALRITMRLFVDVPAKLEDRPSFKTLSDFIGGKFFCESLSLRVACASVAVFIMSIYSIIQGGFRYYDLFGGFFAIFAAVAGTPLFALAFESEESGNRSRLLKSIGKIAICASLTFSFSQLPLQGVRPELAAAFAFTVSLCASDGLGISMVASVVCGALCSTEAIPILIIASFTAYCVLDISAPLSAAVACVSGSICGVVILGSRFMTDSFLSLLTGCAFYATAQKIFSNLSSGNTKIKSKRKPVFSVLEKDTLSYSLLKDTARTFEELSEFAPIMLCAKEISESLTKEAELESEENKELSNSIARRLYELGFGHTDVCITGKRQTKIRICGERLTGSYERLDFIRRRTEQLASFPLSLPKTDESGTSLLLNRESAISYHHAVALSPKEDVCGDSAAVFFDSRRNLLFALICDGMGSGSRAAEVSSRALGILKPLLLCGLSPEKAVGTLGRFLKSDSPENEISTTVDLFVLDLYDGKAKLIKSGSAPSYIIKKGEIIRLSSRTLPAGIFDYADFEKQSFELKSGEIFVMASDGIAESESDSVVLLDYFNSHRERSPEELANDIIELARSEGKTDDLSTIAIKIFPSDY